MPDAPTKPRKPGKSIPDGQRKRKKATWTLNPLAIDVANAGAELEGISPSQWVENAIFAHGKRPTEE